MDEYLTTEEVAEVTRCSPATVRYWHYIGTGPPSIKPGRRRLYPREEFRQWLNQQVD